MEQFLGQTNAFIPSRLPNFLSMASVSQSTSITDGAASMVKANTSSVVSIVVESNPLAFEA